MSIVTIDSPPKTSRTNTLVRGKGVLCNTFTTYFLILSSVPNHVDYLDDISKITMFNNSITFSSISKQNEDYVNVYISIMVNNRIDMSFRNGKYNSLIQKALVGKVKYLSYARAYIVDNPSDSHRVGCEWVLLAHDTFEKGNRIDKLRTLFTCGYELK